MNALKNTTINAMRSTVNYSILYALAIFNFFSREKNEDSVLIIKLEVLGDFIIFLPALKAYREIYKGKRLVLLVDHAQNAELSKNLIALGIIDECIFVNSKEFVRNISYRFRISLKLRQRHFSTAIYTAYFRRNIGNFLTQVTKAKERFAFVGFGIEFNGENHEKHMLSGALLCSPAMFTKAFSLNDYSINEYERNFKLAELISGHAVKRIDPYFPFVETAGFEAGTVAPQTTTSGSATALAAPFNLPEKYVVLNPGSGRDYRRWPEDRFAKVGAHIVAKGFNVVITGGPNETALGEKVRGMILDAADAGKSARQKVIVLSGKTSPAELAAVMKSGVAVISNDTGSIHVAASVGVPAICIMGCGGYPAFFPYADLSKNIAVVKLSPTCTRAWKCTETEEYVRNKKTLAPCIDNVTVDAVLNALNPFL